MANSQELFARAQRVIVGGVNSPVRAFGAVGGDPVYFQRGQGACLYSVDGREYVDFCGSWGPLLLGHAHPAVVAAVQTAAADGLSFGANCQREVEFAEYLQELVPSLERLRLTSSGTEACMTALRLARGCTGRARFLKFEGCYHGHSDAFLLASGSGLLTQGVSSSAGVPPGVAADGIVVPYNDLAAVTAAVRRYGSELAAIIVEPIAGNMGLVPPDGDFLPGLRRLCDECGALLIFDEVINGFRLGRTTYGELCGLRPDLTCLGKILGGGMPLAALGGKAVHMERLAPLGTVYQAGTLSGNPVAVAAGLATLKVLRETNPYAAIERKGQYLQDGMAEILAGSRVPCHLRRSGGMFTLFFGPEPIRNLGDAKRCDTRAFAAFFQGMLARGIYLPPSQFEVAFISAAHEGRHLDAFLAAAQATFATLA